MRRTGWAIAAGALAAVMITGGVAAAVRVNAAPPPPLLRLSVPDTYVPLPGPPVPVQQPPQGSLALQGMGRNLALLDADTPHPIASVAKTMTAYLVLQAHPLADDLDEGPVLTMTAADVADYRRVVAEDGSSLPVVAGEKLTERQLLLGLLLPSANNFADTLGAWVAGSVDSFVARLNSAAQSMGMSHTHFADPSGFSPETVSSAADLVILGKNVLAVPALAALVATQHAQLPDGTALDNLDTLLGTEPGWLGIKTGNTDQAGGCLLFAARRTVGSAQVTLVGAVLGQSDLHAALDAARSAVNSGFLGYGVIKPVDIPAVEGQVTTRWGDSSTVHVVARGGDPEGLPVRLGTVFRLSYRPTALAAAMPSDRVVAVVDGDDGDGNVFTWKVALDRPIARPSAMWLLFRN